MNKESKEKEDLLVRKKKFISLYHCLFDGIKLFIKGSRISLFFILLLVILITNVDQGGILFVELLHCNTLDLILFYIIGRTFALILSHYPSYSMMWKEKVFDSGQEGGNDVKWYMKGPKFLGMGIVVFKDLGKRKKEGAFITGNEAKIERNKITNIAHLLRGYLGVLYHLAFIYIALMTFHQYKFEPMLSGFDVYKWIFIGSVFILFVLSILLYRYLFLEKKAKKIIAHKRSFLVVFYSSALATLLTIICCHIYGWSDQGIILFCATEILSICSFIYFRFLRTSFYKDSSPSFWVAPFRLLAKHENYLKLMTLVGWLCLLIFVFSNISFGLIGPVVLVLCIFNLIYGFIIIPTKHYFFYRSRQGESGLHWMRRVFLYSIPVATIAAILLFWLSDSIGNGLHKVGLVTEKEVMTKVEYLKETKDRIQNSEHEKVYFIASYGGGLMANYWNHKLFEEMREIDSLDVLNHTIAMSGVSGGSLGQAFYLTMMSDEEDVRENKIKQLGMMNPLSPDIAYTFGADFLREFAFGIDDLGADRAGRAMSEYAKVLDSNDATEMSFRSYWRKKYFEAKEKGKSLPVLLSNSTGLRNTRGVACSIDLDEDFHTVFFNSENIAQVYNEQVPSYFGAVSCSNRFPILSPAARVPGKGHFVDGGYFENSGLLSLMDFYNFLLKEDSEIFEDKEVVFILVINSKSAYLKSLIDEKNIQYKEKQSGELGAIFGAMAGIYNLPRYLQEKLTASNCSEICLEPIYLPYEISEADIEDLFNGCPNLTEEQLERIENSNAKIQSTVFKYSRLESCEPPLARLLGEKATNYMDNVVASDWFSSELEEKLKE